MAPKRRIVIVNRSRSPPGGGPYDEGRELHGNRTCNKFAFRVTLTDDENEENFPHPRTSSRFVNFLAWQLERGGLTERLHIQGCCEVTKKLRAGQVAAELGLPFGLRGRSTFFKEMHGSIFVNIAYVTSEAYCKRCHGGHGPRVSQPSGTPACVCGGHQDKGVVESVDAVIFGTPSNDVSAADVVSMTRSGVDLASMVQSNPTYAQRNFRFMQFAASLFSPCRDRPPFVLYLWGASGTGKSRFASQLFSRSLTFFAWSTCWFDGYASNHVHVVLDDLRAERGMTPAFLLRMLDRYPCRLPVKGSSIQLNAPCVTITSAQRPSEFWAALCQICQCDEAYGQLERRISMIIKLPDESEELERARYRSQQHAFDASRADRDLQDNRYDLSSPPAPIRPPMFP
jgi:hypothetical protein